MPSKTKQAQGPVIARVTLETPLGPVYLAFSATGLKELSFAEGNVPFPSASPDFTPETELKGETLKIWRQVVKALEDYFGGKPASFEDLPLDLGGQPLLPADLAGTPEDSPGRDHILSGDGPAPGESPSLPGRGPGLRRQPHPADRSLPPGHRQQRRSGGFQFRSGTQALAACA